MVRARHFGAGHERDRLRSKMDEVKIKKMLMEESACEFD